MVIIFLFVFLIINNRFEHELTVKFWQIELTFGDVARIVWHSVCDVAA